MNEELGLEILRLKEKAIRYELLFELSDDAILVIENEKFVDCNQAVIKMLGYDNKSQLLDTHPSELSPERQPDGELSFEKAEQMIALAIKNGSHHFEWVHTRANGEDFPVEVWISSVRHNDKLLLNTIWRDLTEVKKKEEKIKASLKEKEALLKEIHHRVKNNLQVITSLMSLQSGLMDDEKTKEIFRCSQFRINSMAIIHEMLYQTEDIYTINYGDYLQELISSIISSMKGHENAIELELNVPDLLLNIDTAIPLGLMINEIITNSVKYGFNEGHNAVLTVLIKKSTHPNYIMEIGDNGVGFSDEINFNTTKSLGLKLIRNLVIQLNGSIEKDNSKKGTNYIITFQQVE